MRQATVLELAPDEETNSCLVHEDPLGASKQRKHARLTTVSTPGGANLRGRMQARGDYHGSLPSARAVDSDREPDDAPEPRRVP
jgi:hypothetical protein